MALISQAVRLPVFSAGVLSWPTDLFASEGSEMAGVSWITWNALAGLIVATVLVSWLFLRHRRVNRKAKAITLRIEHLLRQSNDGIVGLDDGMVVRFINPAARHMLGGITRDVPFDWPATIRFHAVGATDALTDKETPFARALAGERVWREAVDLDRRPGLGHKRRLQVTCADLAADPSGASIMATLTDQTSHAKADCHPDRRPTHLSFGILNDFNNALATIAYAIDLSLKHRLPEKPTGYLMTALSTVERGQNLTRRLLQFAKEADEDSAPCVVEPLLAGLGKAFEATFASGVAVSVSCDDPLLILRCKQDRIEKVLFSLVAERAEALSQLDHHGRIWVEARLAQPSKTLTRLALLLDEGTPFVEIVVSDNGPALGNETERPDDYRSSSDIYAKPALRGAAERASVFARGEGGDLRVISDGAEGVSLSLVLPGIHAQSPVQPIWQAKPERGDGETIFVVEDEASLLLMLQEELEDLGYRVISATSGAAALGLIEQGVEFDLVITDIILPGEINGFDLAARIQALRHGASVLYMSGYHGFDTTDMGVAKAPILKKPAPPYELAQAVKLALVNRLH